MELYIVKVSRWSGKSEILTEKLEIVKETPKTINVSKNISYINRIIKSEIDVYINSTHLDPYVICTSIEHGKNMFKEYYNKRVVGLEKEINSVKDIISKL